MPDSVTLIIGGHTKGRQPPRDQPTTHFKPTTQLVSSGLPYRFLPILGLYFNNCTHSISM
jgi:hypothetical protein